MNAEVTVSLGFWPEAVQAAGIYKGRIGTQADFNVMSDYLYTAADIEKTAFQALSKIKWPA